jgi:ketosteroid isomerase-like protein
MTTHLNKQQKNNERLVPDLPTVIQDLVTAQNSFDSTAYALCFAETAVVFDEGKMHKGKQEIKNWIEKANKQYKAVMKPIAYSAATQILKAEISGNFAGSPLVLKYQFDIKEKVIHSLKIV